MSLTQEIKDNIYYFENDKQINKIHKTVIIYKESKFHELYLSILLDAIINRTKKFDKLQFKLEKSRNYDLMYNASMKELDNNLLINLEISFVNVDYLSEDDALKMSKFIDHIFEELFVENKDLEISIENHTKFIKNIKDKPNQMGNFLINNYIYKRESKYLSYDETLKELESDSILLNVSKMLEKLKSSRNYYYFIEGSKNSMRQISSKLNSSSMININNEYKNTIDHNYEELDFTTTNKQVTLIMTYQLEIINKEDEELLKVLNRILGGSSSSKLFVNVREKESICYSISSRDKKDYGIQVIAEVDKSNIELAKEKINEQIIDIQNGNIEYEFEVTIQKFIADIKANSNKGYLQKIILDKNIIRETNIYDIDKTIMALEHIKVGQIVDVCKRLKLSKTLEIS